MTTFDTVALPLIVASRTNPRKHFDPTKLAELAESIKASGVHSPVLLRPLPGDRVADTDRAVQYELVAGERRYRASQLAGVLTIPAMIRPLTDDQVLEIQLVENLQRDDLNALEEAEGYQALMAHSNISADDVGVKIGKSRAYVYARIKLLDCSQEVKQAMREGTLDFSRALRIARIPDSTLQAKALAEALAKDYLGEVCSVRAFEAWLQANVMLRLDKAVFKITDTRLVQAAGSCTACPKRTGANPDLFADTSSTDLCIDPACYHGKEAAHRSALVAMAAKKGMQFIEGKEAKELIPHQYTDRIYGYLPLSQKREDCIKDGQTGLTLRELLGDDAPAPVLIENPFSKALIEAVPEDETEGVLTAKGLRRSGTDNNQAEDTPQARKATAKRLELQIKSLQNRAEHSLQDTVDEAVRNATRDAIRAMDNDKAKALIGPAMLRAYLTVQIDNHSPQLLATALGYEFAANEDKQDGIVQFIKATDHANLCRATAICFMWDEYQASDYDQELPVRNHLAMAGNVNTKAVTKTATKEVQAKFAGEIEQLQVQLDALTKPKKEDIPHSPLAQPKNASGSAQEGLKAKGKKAPAAPRAPKLSPEEAKSGIAAAMQEQERAGTAPPEGPQHDQGGLDVGFATGQRVRITTIEERLSNTARKWSGKVGTITKTNADNDSDLYDVTFKGRTGGIAMFRTDQLEAADVEAAAV